MNRHKRRRAASQTRRSKFCEGYVKQLSSRSARNRSTRVRAA